MPEEKFKTYFTVEAHDVVHLLEFSPFDWCSQLMAVATATRISIASCRFQAEDSSISGIEWEPIRDFHHGSRVTALAWSPETNLLAVPRVLKFCIAESDRKVRLLSSDLKADDIVQVLGEHEDYVNSLCFQPEKGDLLASVSDDHTCRVWSMQGQQVACFPLGAPGMKVCWHPHEPAKIMVAEKKGIIRFYNVSSQQPIMSLDCGHSPLTSADWCHGNSLRVAAVAGTDCFIFDTSRSSHPLESQQGHSEGCQLVHWCRSHDHLLATTGRPACQLKVLNIKTNQVSLSTEQVMLGGLSWHYRLPIVAVGGDGKIHLWHVDTM